MYKIDYKKITVYATDIDSGKTNIQNGKLCLMLNLKDSLIAPIMSLTITVCLISF